MSRRNSSSAGTVSLFPFLAVLVCAMGALILLLLVTTRRIRQRTLAEEVIVVPAIDEFVAPTANPTPSAAPPIVAAVPEPLDSPIMPLLAVDPLPTPKPFDPNPDLKRKLAVLQAQQELLAADIAQRRQMMADLERTTLQEREKQSELDATRAAMSAEKERLSNLYVRLREQIEETEQRADELRQRVQRAREQAADADSRFAVVPYDGELGTMRRPIIIECTADRFTFVSEGVSLSPSDLDGFTPRYNPLLYVTKALIRYWERQDRTSSEDLGQPYVMLVVRPGGTTGYYVARGLLSELDQTFGYELVTDDLQFAWPASNLEAIAICKTIITKMLNERDELMEHALHGGANLSDFSNDRGEFRLEEIDRLQSPTREVTINGQHFSREPRADFPRTDAEDVFGRYAERDNLGGASEDSRNSKQPDNDGGFGESDVGPGGPAADGKAVHAYAPPRAAVTPEPAPLVPDWLRDSAARASSLTDRSGSTDTSATNSTSRADGAIAPAPTDLAPPLVAGIDESSARPGSNSFGDSATSTEQPAGATPHRTPEMIKLNPPGKRGEPAVDPIRPQWGIRTAGGTIGYERDVRVVVSSTQVSIGERNGFQIDKAMSLVDLRRLLAASIDREVRNWGPPPKSFYWVPSIHFVVSPDGRATQDRLRTIVQSWELRSTAEFANE